MKMKEKFTQGDWIHHLDGTIRSSDCTQIIGTYTMSGPFRNSEQEANAHLIAAAPKMYRMLDKLAFVAEKSGSKDEAEMIYKLLAEARGESKDTD